ncbi:MAG: tetratricopeptide repeat protein [Akkermansia sp.]|nr:tetratricopeptide repeat protein [Akkermansia sp.]
MKVNKSFACLMALGMLPVPALYAQQADDADLVVNPEDDAYAIAEHLYAQARQSGVDAESRQVGLSRAAVLFGDFVKKYPQSANATKAQYLQAVCLEECGEIAKSDAVLEKVAARKNGGEFAAAAAYNLAKQAASRNLWTKARNYYSITVRETRRPELSTDALYRLGRTHLQLGQKKEAEDRFKGLLLDQSVSPVIVNASLYALAQMKTEEGKHAEAYDFFSQLLKRNGVEEGMRGMATLQAARLASRLGKGNEAQQLYAKLTGMPGMEKYAGEAQMETLMSLYKNKDFEGVVRQITSNYAPLDDPAKEARRALIVGQCFMELRNYERAAQWFEVAEQAQPQTSLAADAAYRRLLCAQQTRSVNFFTLAQRYLNTYAAPGQSTASLACNDLVRLMYADRMMLADVPEASRQFEAINMDNIPESVRADAMYKKAWCSAQGGSGDPVSTLDKFIASYPKDTRMPEALALRGSCYVKMNNIGAALADFERVINEYPHSNSVPMCWQRAAQAVANRDSKKMVAYYEGLIKCAHRGVKPAAIAEAHYNIARAQYESDPGSAIPHFREARTLNPEQYGAAVDLSLVHCYFKMKDADKLREALVVLERNNSSSYNALPPAVPRWCGWMCFQSKRYLDADKYLSDAVARASREKYTAADGTQKERAAVEPLVWKTLARARLELRQYERGLEAAEHYVSMETQPYRKAEGMRDNALLLIGLMRTAEARKLCESAIALGIDGPIKSAVFITLGDSYYAEREFAEAAKYYGRTANVVSDKDLKPMALYKISQALRRCERAGEAAQYEDTLHKEFPNWLPEPNTAIFMKMHDKQ